MILGRKLTAAERCRSQNLYCAFNFINGMSYMCLGEGVLVLFAAQLGAPNSVVSLLGALLYVGYAMLPVGVLRTARRGAAACQADFWIARNAAALVTASAAAVWVASPQASWAVLVAGAFLFYGCRAAGSALFTPLLGDVSTEEEASSVIGRTTGFFNLSAVAAIACVTAVMHRWHGRIALAAIIVTGAALGICSSFFVRGMYETGAIRDAAREPLRTGMRRALRNRALRRLSLDWFLLNLSIILFVPISVLALKRGCGFADSRAMICACAQFGAGTLASFVCGPLCRAFGPRRVMAVSALGFAAVPFAWLLFPETGPLAMPSAIMLFFWLGGCYYAIYNTTNAAFLEACPDKRDQVAGSVAVNLLAGAGAGVAGSALGAWLVSISGDLVSALPFHAFAGPLGQFRLFFLLVLPVPVAALLVCMLPLQKRGADARNAAYPTVC